MQTTAIFGPPGTGKTQQLINLIAEIRKANRETMAVVSFSKAAANELVKRIPDKPEFVGTIHSFCFNQLGLSRHQVVSTLAPFINFFWGNTGISDEKYRQCR